MAMLNYKYTVNLDTPRSNCTIENVQEVKIQRLPDTDKYDALCANGAMASFEICRFLKEYGRAFFFQAADILDAMKLNLWVKQTASEIQNNEDIKKAFAYMGEGIKSEWFSIINIRSWLKSIYIMRAIPN